MSPYQAIEGETTLVDTTGGDVDVLAPVSPQDNSTFAIRKLTLDDKVCRSVAIAGDSIETPFDVPLSLQQVAMIGGTNQAEWQYNSSVNTWLCITSTRLSTYKEFWSATGITGLTGTQTIQWTFQPSFAGQTPAIVSESAGVFTFNFDGIFNVQVAADFRFISTTNNNAAQLTLAGLYTGTGTWRFNNIIRFAELSRPKTVLNSAFGPGEVIPNANDTLAMQTTVNLQDAGVTMDLVSGQMQMST